MKDIDVRGWTWAAFLTVLAGAFWFAFWVGSWSGFIREVLIPGIYLGAIIFLFQKAPDLGIVPEIDLEVAG